MAAFPFEVGKFWKQLFIFAVLFAIGFFLGNVEFLNNWLSELIGVEDLSNIMFAGGVSLPIFATMIVDWLKKIGAIRTEEGAVRGMWIATASLALLYWVSLPENAPFEQLSVWIPIAVQFVYNVLGSVLGYRFSAGKPLVRHVAQ